MVSKIRSWHVVDVTCGDFFPRAHLISCRDSHVEAWRATCCKFKCNLHELSMLTMQIDCNSSTSPCALSNSCLVHFICLSNPSRFYSHQIDAFVFLMSVGKETLTPFLSFCNLDCLCKRAACNNFKSFPIITGVCVCVCVVKMTEFQ